jgi:uncharacterized phage protein (TIGR01671 family)
MSNTKPSLNEAENGNKLKPLLSSRLFKFRVYDRYTNTMLQMPNLTIELGVVEPNYDTETIMFSSGLTDKNGIEIFEGDLLKNPNGRVGIVSFENGSFGLTIHKSNTSKHRIIFSLSFLENKEVIGNFFENPELFYAVREAGR